MSKYYFIVNGVIYLTKETDSNKVVNDTAKMIRDEYMEKGDHLEIKQITPEGSQITLSGCL